MEKLNGVVTEVKMIKVRQKSSQRENGEVLADIDG